MKKLISVLMVFSVISLMGTLIPDGCAQSLSDNISTRNVPDRVDPVAENIAGMKATPSAFRRQLLTPGKGNEMVSAPLVSPAEAKKILTSEPAAKGVDSAASEMSAMPVLSATSAITSTPELQTLSQNLRNDPQLIYEFVRNTIDYVPIFGSLKGASMTLADGKGNDFDQSSLLIALLREAGFTANYVYGRIHLDAGQITNWLGIPNEPNVVGNLLASAGIPADIWSDGLGGIAYVEMDHVWVKATISGVDYVFDPSNKAYSQISGINLASALGYDKSTFLSRAAAGMTSDPNFVQNVNQNNIRSDLTTFAGNLTTYIKATMPGATLEQVIGGKQIVEEKNEAFQTTLPHEISRDDEWTDVPAAYETTLRIEYEGIDETLAVSEFYGKRVTLSFSFDGSNYQPYLLVDGTTIATGNLIPSWGYYPCTLTVDHPYAANGGTYCDDVGTIYPATGQIYYISTGWSGVGRAVIEKHRKSLKESVAQGAAADSEAVLGETLTMIGLTWMAETSRSAIMGDVLSDTITIQHHELGLVGQESAPFMDMPMSLVSIVSLNNNAADTSARMYARSGINSAFEWGAIDQLQSISAVSTIKLLDMANSQSDMIFDADSSNYAAGVRPNLQNYSSYGLSLIDSYIGAGYRLILPEHGNITDGAYQGVGFIAISPYGGMANMIAGGLSGGYGNDYGMADHLEALENQELKNNCLTDDHPKSEEPIDLATGYYLHQCTDLTMGRGKMPFGLSFARSYSSAERLSDSTSGLGWSHNWDLNAAVSSDGFRGLGDSSPLDAAPAVAELFIATDILRDGLLNDRLVIATLAHRWFMDNLIDNIVDIQTLQKTLQFVKSPDGAYNPPPGTWGQLSDQGGGSFLFTGNHGNQLLFDISGKLTTWTDPNGNQISLSYSSGLLSQINNNLGQTVTLGYDGNNRIDSVSDGTGRSVNYQYDVSGNLEKVIDAETNETNYQYDLDGRLTRVFLPSDPVNPSVINSYDQFDRVTTQDDSAGNRYTYYFSGSRTEEVNPLGNSRVYYFDGRGRNILMMDPLGNETSFSYDGQDRLVKTILPETNGTEFDYDQHHNCIRKTVNPKTGTGETPIIDQFAYDLNFNHKTSTTDALGNTTSFTYDGNGNLLRVEGTAVDGSTPYVDFTVNARGQVLTITGPNGAIKSQSYDPATGFMSSVTLDQGGLNLTVNYTYDAVGNLTGLMDARGNTCTYEYDDNRRVTKEFLPPPFNYETRYAYDGNGNRSSISRQADDLETVWQNTYFSHNLAGTIQTLTDPQGMITTYQYDQTGEVWKVTDANTRTIEFLYDEMGRPYRQKDASGSIVEEHTYTPNGKTASLKDANGNQTSYTYGPFDGLSRIDYEDGTYVAYTYDTLGHLVSERTRTGQTITYGYDELGRLETKAVPGEPLIQISYDLSGKMTQLLSGTDSISHVYDPIGRLTSVTHADGRTLGYQYDAEGNRTRLTYPDGSFMTYSYDELNRMTEMRENGVTLVAQYSYDSLSRQESHTFGNGTSASITFENDNQVASISHQYTGGSVSFGYSYDVVNNLLGENISDPAYRYSPVSLTEVSSPNALNQIDSVNGQLFTYDLNGNLTNDGLSAYTYDTQNRLKGVVTPSQTISYTYDAVGRRVTKTIDGVTTYFVYDGNQLLGEYNGSGTNLRQYVYGPGVNNPVRMKTPGAEYYYHTNNIGSVVGLSDGSGQAADIYSYSPFGEPLSSGSSGNPILYTGQIFDAETGLYYFHERYYSASLGKFLSPDPMGSSGGDLNQYTYCLNNPTMYVDPDGRFPLAVVIAGGALVIVGAGGYAVDHVELPWDPWGQEGVSQASWVAFGPTWKKQHPAVRESMLIHERVHKWNFHGLQVWKTPAQKETEAYSQQYAYLLAQRELYRLKGDDESVAKIDEYIQQSVIEVYLNQPEVLERVYPGKSVLGNIGDFFSGMLPPANGPTPGSLSAPMVRF